jgi:hypothetical protein
MMAAIGVVMLVIALFMMLVERALGGSSTGFKAVGTFALTSGAALLVASLVTWLWRNAP